MATAMTQWMTLAAAEHHARVERLADELREKVDSLGFDAIDDLVAARFAPSVRAAARVIAVSPSSEALPEDEGRTLEGTAALAVVHDLKREMERRGWPTAWFAPFDETLVASARR